MNLSVRGKLFAGFGLALVAIGLVSLLALSKLGALNAKTEEVGGGLEGTGAVVQLVRGGEEIHRTAFVGALALVARGQTTDPAKQKELADQADEHLGELTAHIPEFDKALAQAQRGVDSPKEKELVDGIAKDWAALKPRLDGTLATVRKGDALEAINALLADEIDGTLDEMNGKIDAFKESLGKEGAERVSEANATYTGAQRLLIILALVAAAIVAAVAVLLSSRLANGFRTIADRLDSLGKHDQNDLASAMHAMAEGDLSRPVAPTTEPITDLPSDEIGAAGRSVNAILDANTGMIDAYNTMRESLAELVGAIGTNAATLGSASNQMSSTSEEAGRAVGEIASAVTDVAQGAERQVRMVEETREAVQEAARAAEASALTAQSTAEAADDARRVASDGVEAAELATDVMRQVAASSQQVAVAIEQLSERSQQIGGIVDTITGIAEQTNLLALNAAIEAARAGDQGKGFAVVADEVRKLAEESQGAAGQIAALVREIQSETEQVVGVVAEGAARTDEGVATVERTRDSFTAIGEAVAEMSERIGEISSAVHEISDGAHRAESSVAEVAAVAEQSSASAQQVSASTQQTSASTQEIAASSHALATTAEQLNELVRRFKVAA